MVYLAITAAVFGLDCIVKKKIEKEKELNVTEEIANGRILLRRTNNSGMAFGIFRKNPQRVKGLHNLAIGMMCLSDIVLLTKKGCSAAKAGMSLILGGGLSNWYDRYRQGYVTDYFSFSCKWKKLEKIVFNLSDLFIFTGVVLFGCSQLFGRETKEGKQK